MGDTSKIESTDSTFNPWIGCQHASPGCDHCYAESQNAFRNWAADGAWGPHAERKRTSLANWKKPRLWDVNAKRFEREHGRRHSHIRSTAHGPGVVLCDDHPLGRG